MVQSLPRPLLGTELPQLLFCCCCCLSFASWISPSIVVALGSRVAMILTATTYLFYMANFFILVPWLIYVANVILGIGAAVIWTAQGNLLANNSDPTTITRNSG